MQNLLPSDFLMEFSDKREGYRPPHCQNKLHYQDLEEKFRGKPIQILMSSQITPICPPIRDINGLISGGNPFGVGIVLFGNSSLLGFRPFSGLFRCTPWFSLPGRQSFPKNDTGHLANGPLLFPGQCVDHRPHVLVDPKGDVTDEFSAWWPSHGKDGTTKTHFAQRNYCGICIHILIHPPRKEPAMAPISSSISIVPKNLPDRISSLLADFLSALSPRTQALYSHALGDFTRFLGAKTPRDAVSIFFQMTPGEANSMSLRYRTDLVSRGLSPSSVNLRLSALRSLTRMARIVGLIFWAIEVRNVKRQTYQDTKGPDREDVARIVQTLRASTLPKDKRDLAIIRLAYDLGLRRAEISGLDRKDVDLLNGRILVKGKGRMQPEYRTLPAETIKALSFWLHFRGSQEGPLFVNFDHARKGSGRITGAGIYHVISSRGKYHKVQVRPHALRHSAITEALRLFNGNIQVVQRFSRHKDPRTVLIYDDNREDLAGKVARAVAASLGA